MKAIGLRWMLVTMLGFVLLAPGITVGDGSQMETEGGSTEALNATPVAPEIPPPTSSSQPLDWLKSLSGEPITSLSDAELIALIGRSIESDKRYLETLTEELESEDNPFTRASEFFEKYDQELKSLRFALEEAQQIDQQAPKESLEAEIGEFETVHSLAKERFDLAIERRRLMVQMVPLIQMRRAQSQIMMGYAFGETDPGVAVEPAYQVNGRVEETQDVPRAEPPSGPSAVYSPPGTAPKSTDVPETPLTSPSRKRPPSEEFVLATAEVRQWEQTLAEVHENIRMLEARLEIGDRALKLERSMAENGRQMLDNSEALRTFFSEQFQQRSLDGLSAAELEPIRQTLQETIQLSKMALERSRTATDRVASITAARTHLLEALATRKMDAHLAGTELEHARTQMARIQNPFPHHTHYLRSADGGPLEAAFIDTLAGGKPLQR